MERSRLLELIDAYLELRLSAADRAVLEASLVADQAARRLFWECTHQHALIAELLAEARGRQMATEEVLAASVLVPAPEEEPLSRSPRRFAPWLAGMALGLLLALGLWWLNQAGEQVAGPVADSALARLAELRGPVTVRAGREWIEAREGQIVRPGQEIQTGQGAFAVVTYADSSRLELNADTSVRILRETDEEGRTKKRVFLLQGVVNANVAPQPNDRPMVFSTQQADFIAPRARFSSANLMGETRIEVEEGSARLTRREDGQSFEVSAGNYAVAASNNFGFVPMLPTSRGPAAVLEEGSGPVLGVVPVKQGKQLAVACWSGDIKLYDITHRRVVGLMAGEHRQLRGLAVADDGRTLVGGYEPQGKAPRGLPGVVVWNVDRRREVFVPPGVRRATALAITPDGRTTVFVGQSQHNQRGIFVWDEGDPRERLILGERHERAEALAVHADGRTLAAGSRDGRIRLWDLQTGRPILTLEKHSREVQSLAFGPGDLLATGGRDGTIRLWSTNTGDELRKMTGKFNEVRCLAFSPDGRTLATGHAGFAVLWDVQTGEQRTTLKAHKFALTALAYLPDGRTLVSAGWDRCVKLWDLQPVDVN